MQVAWIKYMITYSYHSPLDSLLLFLPKAASLQAACQQHHFYHNRQKIKSRFYPNLFSFTSLTNSSLSIFRWFCSSPFILFHNLISSGLPSFSASRTYFSTAEWRKSAFFSS